MKRRLLLCCALLFAFGAYAQERMVSGKVTSAEDGTPLPGVNVFVKGSSNGTVTDIEGNYRLSVPSSGGTLTFSFIGMTTTEEPIGDRSTIDIKLSSDVKQLTEVIVTALGERVDRDKFASSVSTVTGGSVARSGETGALQGLTGKTAGVIVTRNGGDPGSGAYIQIRGQNTINGNAQPLFIVDGIPVSNSFDNTKSGAGNSIVQQSRINDINPEDIASMEILKGASAAALWGTRAANGVIIITTKKGKDTNGKVNINFKSTVSFDKVNKIHELQRTYGQGVSGMYAQGNRVSWGDKIADRKGGPDTFITDPSAPGYNGFLTLPDGTKRYAIAAGTAANPHGGKNSKDTYDHQMDAFRTGYFTDNTVSFSGGNARTTFMASYGNLSQKGIIKSFSDYSRHTARANVSSQFTEWLRVSTNAAYTKSFSTRAQGGDNLDGLFLGGLRTSPDFDNSEYTGSYTTTSGLILADRHVSYRNPLGKNDNPSYSNPLWNIHNNKNTTDVDRFTGSGEIQIDPLSWLSVTGRAGVDNFVDNRNERFPLYSASYPQGFYSKYVIMERQFNTDLFARASKSFSEKFSATLMAGVNYNSRRESRIYSQITQFIIPTAPDILANALNSNLVSNNTNQLIRTYAYYGSVDLQALDMFFLTLTGRSESASTFSKSFFFPSAALAWQFNKLSGLSNSSVLSFGKLRLTYGQVGIQPQPYLNTTLFNTATYGDYAGAFLAASSLYGGGTARSTVQGNPNLKPERVTEMEIGGDFRFLSDRITLGITAYHRVTDDLIIQLGKNTPIGFSSSWTNAAKMQNNGVEVEIGSDIIKKGKFTWNLSANYSMYRNKVLDLAGSAAQILPNSYGGFAVMEGQPFGIFFGTDFIHDEKGTYELDANGFPKPGESNEVIGNANPKWRGGIGNMLSYGGFSLYVLVDRVYGNEFFNGTRGALYTFGTHADNGNEVVSPVALKDVEGNTIPANTPFRGAIHDFGGGPVALTQAWYQGMGTSFSSASVKQFIEDASTFRIREITGSYRIATPGFKAKTKLNSIDLSVTARNWFLWTPFTGVDPEVNITGSGIVRGEDWFTNPNTKSILFTLGITY